MIWLVSANAFCLVVVPVAERTVVADDSLCLVVVGVFGVCCWP